MSGFQLLFNKWRARDAKVSSQIPPVRSLPPPASSVPSSVSVSGVSPSVSTVPSRATSAPSRASSVPSRASPVPSRAPPIPSRALSVEVERLSNLAPEYLQNAIRPSSRKTYSSYWNRYKAWCDVNMLNLRKAESISMFLIKLAEESESKRAPLLAKYGIKYFLKLQFPFSKCATDSYYTRRISKAISTKFSKPIKKASPLGSSVVKDVVQYLLSTGNFKDERSAVFLLTQCVMFARFEETANLKVENVSMLPSGELEFRFVKAKNYDVHDARSSIMAKGNGAFDPVKIFSSYFEKVSKLGAEWLFPNFTLGKKKSIILKPKPVSYANMLKLFRGALEDIGLESKNFSLHSVRSGAVSEAANKNVNSDSLARHVRWKNKEMINTYHKLSLSKKLEAPQSLDIYSS